MNVFSRALVLAVLVASPLAAQPWSGSFTAASGAANLGYQGYGVGPYRGTLTVSGAPAAVQVDITRSSGQFSFWCVDGAGVFQSGPAVQLHTIASIADAALRVRVAQAAYVTVLHGEFAGTRNGANVSNFNAAIWSIMGAMPSGFTGGNAATVASYVAEAQDNYGRLNLENFYYVRFSGQSMYERGGAQELVFQGSGPLRSVPEPGMWVLLATGLLALGVVARGRVVA